MRRWQPIIILLLLLVALLALVATGTVGELLVVPLLALVWIARLLYQSIPQFMIWGALLAVGLVVLLRSLPWHAPARLVAVGGESARGRVAVWLQALEGAERDQHTRWRFAQRLSELAVEALALKEGRTPGQIRQRLTDRQIELPAELAAYLRAGIAPYAPESAPAGPRWRRGTATRIPSPLDVAPEQVIEQLERVLE